MEDGTDEGHEPRTPSEVPKLECLLLQRATGEFTVRSFAVWFRSDNPPHAYYPLTFHKHRDPNP